MSPGVEGQRALPCPGLPRWTYGAEGRWWQTGCATPDCLPALALPVPWEKLKLFPEMAEPMFVLLHGKNRVGDRLPRGTGSGKSRTPRLSLEFQTSSVL